VLFGGGAQCSPTMELPIERDLGAYIQYGDLAEGDDKRCVRVTRTSSHMCSASWGMVQR
jgi:hypothetical protein